MIMTKLTTFFIYNIAVLIFLLGINKSVVSSRRISSEYPEPTERNSQTKNDDFFKLHPGLYVEQLVKTNVGGRVQYVLGARIAGNLGLGMISVRAWFNHVISR